MSEQNLANQIRFGNKLKFMRNKLKLTPKDFCFIFNQHALYSQGTIDNEDILEQIEEGLIPFMLDQAITLHCFTFVDFEDLSSKVCEQTFENKYSKLLKNYFDHQLGAKLKFVRKKLGLSQEAFLKEFNRCAMDARGQISNQSKLSRIEEGQTKFYIDHAVTWMRFIGIPLRDLSLEVSYILFIEKYSDGFYRQEYNAGGQTDRVLKDIVKGRWHTPAITPRYVAGGFTRLESDATHWLLQMMGYSLETIKKKHLVQSYLLGMKRAKSS